MSDRPTETAANDRRDWDGHDGRWCREHQSVGGRAWCFDCSEWCYPHEDGACARCRLPMLEAENERLRAQIEHMKENPFSHLTERDMGFDYMPEDEG